ncbi:LytR/AlgR family response regulator transcription factor [Larkinella soli]|uniref:LytR/AlgR family response regulator transcription factor n=1 Tax=Larkinella soli TaxID=1770527 RepID=UPI000FFBDA84|nr:LytTR family DNA-binding domain-containing protein [Larkinella soli]
MKLQLYYNPRSSYSENQLQALTRHLNLPDVVLPFWGQRKRVPVYRIVRLEGEGNYTVLHFSDGTQLIVSLTLKKLEGRLPSEIFVRPHKKNIINLLYLQEIHPDKNMMISLTNGVDLEVSRRKAGQFLKVVSQFQQELLPLTAFYATA